MFGKNSIAPIISKGGEFLEVVDIFLTIQGEGPFCGIPAVFIRLGGCNLQCQFCDTEFSDFHKLSLDKIIEETVSLTKNNKTSLVVITGGEPLRQPIEKLCSTLIRNYFKIQIETNGTIFRKLPEPVEIVCSPKIANKQYNITPELKNYADYFKFLVSAKGKYSTIPIIETNKPVYIQPIDEYSKRKNKYNINYALHIVQKHNYILSLQTHKIMGIK